MEGKENLIPELEGVDLDTNAGPMEETLDLDEIMREFAEKTPEQEPQQLSDDVKQQRRETVMALQTQIADAYCEAQIGKTVTVLVEGFDYEVGLWYGRSAAEAAEIDPKVYFGTEEELSVGEFAEVRILDRWDCDLVGERV